jgi:hypothetical protein
LDEERGVIIAVAIVVCFIGALLSIAFILTGGGFAH